MEEPSIHVLGFYWDQYTPQVEAQLTKDLIGLQEAVTKWPNSVMKVSAGPEAARVIAALNLERADPREAKIWRTYKTGARRVAAPEWAETVIPFDLSIKKSDSNIIKKGPHSGYALKEFGRSNGFDPFNRRPATTKWATSDPLVTMIWGG